MSIRSLASSPADSRAVVQRARSFLFVPGSRPDRFAKADASEADIVILDLEDAVSSDAKDAARPQVAEWLDSHAAVVRVNAPSTPWHRDDLAALAGRPGLLGVIVPKTADPAVLAAAREILGETVSLLPLIESARGVLEAPRIAAAPGVARLLFGNLDFGLDTGLLRPATDENALLLPRSTLVLSSAAAGLPGPVDGVHPAVADLEGLTRSASTARDLGMGAKLCIHPSQVARVHEVFGVDEALLAWAIRVDAARVEHGGGVVTVDDEMLDVPQYERARAILRLAGVGGSHDGEETA